ncbi:MAG: hypothetical protein K9M54_01775 [Kiritimatiellales bacterium]|nr:hypothetical protein [Kiritimatiellales bacterium]MCF7863490.1 hypothetical protein [Kiritimatiellales bacterium]
MKYWVFSLLAAVMLLAGCATTSMKGTPFYTGEYEASKGPASDRVNLWPVVYYRDPALSVLWPLMEFSPDYLAVRPVYSVDGRNEGNPVYNVVWPIGFFDTKHKDYRIFPVFWGDDYLTLFPFYWHKGDPFSGVGYNALFPFWIWNSKADGNSLDVLWPLCAKKNFPDRQEWRIWPLAGASDRNGKQYGYYAWPFAHHWADGTNASGHTVIPLYLYNRKGSRETFVSLPYSRSVSSSTETKSWDLTLPLLYRQWRGDTFGWAAIPALSWGARDGESADSWFALGLGRRVTSSNRSGSHVIPFYYYNRDPSATSFYTVPWWSKSYADDSGWNMLLPVYYRSYSTNASAFYSLPWYGKKRSDGSGWHASIPFYYHSYSNGASAFYSLPWLSEKHGDGSAWQAAFPFYYGSSSTNGSLMLTPLYGRKLQADGSPSWRCLFPIVYLDETKDSHFLTLLGGRWSMGDRYNWLVFPLLSGGAKKADTGRNIWLGGLAGQQWSGDETSHYVFPLYYAAPYAGAFASLPYATWNTGIRQAHVLPPLLSGWYTDESGKSGSILACGLAGHRSGGTDAYSYVFPLYYSAPGSDMFLSLPYAKWPSGNSQCHLVLPLLSCWETSPDATRAMLAAGLVGFRTGKDGYHYVFPLYYSAPDEDSFVSLPYATWRTGDKQSWMLPFLLSGRNFENNATETMLLGGLAYWKTEGAEVQSSQILPFYLWSQDECFYTALYGKNRQMEYYATPLVGRYGDGNGTSGSWVFPFYRHKRLSADEVKGRYLLLGYYDKSPTESRYGFYGLYGYDRKDAADEQQADDCKDINYLLYLGQIKERREYGETDGAGQKTLLGYHKTHSLFPLWNHEIKDDLSAKNRLETSALLGCLYDSRHEQKDDGGEPRDYLRRRVLWRLYHSEKLNGDASTDMFPAITIDSYKNGYYKFSFLWRLFRYEKDPENGTKKLDLLFIPFRR